MYATYIRSADCSRCLDFDFCPDCVSCLKNRKQTVEVLKLGVGFSGNKAVVQDMETKELMTVYIDELKNVKEGEQ